MTWPLVELGEVCEFRYGKSLAAGKRDGGKYAVYGSNGVVGRHSTALSDGPTIVVGRKGSYGEVAFSPDPCWPIDTTYYIDDSATTADLKWLSHRLRGLGLTGLNRAAAIPGLNRDDAYRQRLLLPPPDEQRRIAAILDHADALRLQSAKAQAEVESMAQAIYVNIFGDPISNPRGYPLERLGHVGTLDRGVSKHRPRNDPALLGGPYPLIQTGDVARSGGTISSYTSTYSELGLAQSRLWPAGTLCITIAANIAQTGILAFDACFPDSVVGFTADESTTAYIRTWFTFLQATLEASAPQSAQRNINLALLRDLPVPLPPVADRKRFHECLRTVQEVRATASRRGQQLEELFSALQSRAFSGQL